MKEQIKTLIAFPLWIIALTATTIISAVTFWIEKE